MHKCSSHSFGLEPGHMANLTEGKLGKVVFFMHMGQRRDLSGKTAILTKVTRRWRCEFARIYSLT